MSRPTGDRVLELESRLSEVEQRLQSLVAWQFNLAGAVIGNLPTLPPTMTKAQVVTPPPTPPVALDNQVIAVIEKLLLSPGILSKTQTTAPAETPGSTDHRATKRAKALQEAPTKPVNAAGIPTKGDGELDKDIKVQTQQGHESQEKKPLGPSPSAIQEAKAAEDSIDDQDPFTQLASKILDVLARYGQHLPTTNGNEGPSWPGKFRFLERVKHQVENNEPVKMILPSFPWKSINTVDKVNGRLPDLGEVLALSRLNAMCVDIGKIYPFGAQLTIATDGLVFDDVVGIPDEDTWAYSEALIAIVAEKGFDSIKLARLPDLQGVTADKQPLDKETYLSVVPTCRSRLLEEYGRTEDEIRDMIQTDSDSLLTYRGFIRFLEKDLKHSPIAKTATTGQGFRRCVKKVATAMMIRAESFTKLLAAKCPNHVRLSIHPSTGMAKLSVPLIITDDDAFPRTPWHSVIAVGVDGSYSTVHSSDVRDTHVLVYHQGHPYYHREKSPLWDDWGQDTVMFEPQYPKNLLVYPKNASSHQALDREQIQKLRNLSQNYCGNILVSGFSNAAEVFPESAAGEANNRLSAETAELSSEGFTPHEGNGITEPPTARQIVQAVTKETVDGALPARPDIGHSATKPIGDSLSAPVPLASSPPVLIGDTETGDAARPRSYEKKELGASVSHWEGQPGVEDSNTASNENGLQDTQTRLSVKNYLVSV